MKTLIERAKKARHQREKERRAMRRAAGVISPEEYRRARATTGNGLNAVERWVK